MNESATYYTTADTKVEAIERFYKKLKGDLEETNFEEGISLSKFKNVFGKSFKRIGSSYPYGTVYDGS